MSIQAKRERRAALAKDLNTLVNEFPEDKKWGEADQQKYDSMCAQIEDLDADLQRSQKALDLQAEERGNLIASADRLGISEDEAHHRKELGKQALSAYLRGGISALTDDQRKLLAARDPKLKNAMSTGVGAEGGYTTQNEFAPSLVEAMAEFGGMREVAQVIRTETGSQMDFPTADATAEEGEIVGENASVSAGDTTFGTKSLSVFKYSSKSIAVPFELLQDSQIDIEAYIRKLLATRLQRITNKHYTTGTDSGQPGGIVTASAAGKVGATGQTTSITYDDLVDLEHSVDPAYRVSPKCGFMFHDTTLRELKKLKDLQDRPIWLPGLTSADPNTILNKPYTINQAMPVMAANAKSMLFGDFEKYIIRDVMEVQLFRMTDSKFTEQGQVGFLAFMRSGGGLIDVGGAVKHYQNSAT